MAISSTSRCFPGHTGTGTIWLVNGEGYASATENVASAAVTLNSSTVISAASFTAATEQTEASVVRLREQPHVVDHDRECGRLRHDLRPRGSLIAEGRERSGSRP